MDDPNRMKSHALSRTWEKAFKRRGKKVRRRHDKKRIREEY